MMLKEARERHRGAKTEIDGRPRSRSSRLLVWIASTIESVLQTTEPKNLNSLSSQSRVAVDVEERRAKVLLAVQGDTKSL